MIKTFAKNIKSCTFVALQNTVVVAQLVRVLVCGAEGRGFEPHHPPESPLRYLKGLFFSYNFQIVNNARNNRFLVQALCNAMKR